MGKVTVGIATTVGAALIIAVAGGIANFLVMRSEVASMRTDLATHTARDGHENMIRRVDRLEARLEAQATVETTRAQNIDRRLGNVESTLEDIRDDQAEILRALPSSWRDRGPPERERPRR